MNATKLFKYWVFVYVFIIVGSFLELILLEHFEGIWQKLPLVVLVVNLIGLCWFIWSENNSSTRALQIVIALTVVTGLVGIIMHYNGNKAFELEMYPSIGGRELFMKTITGATPLLAPASIILIGLIGLGLSWQKNHSKT